MSKPNAEPRTCRTCYRRSLTRGATCSFCGDDFAAQKLAGESPVENTQIQPASAYAPSTQDEPVKKYPHCPSCQVALTKSELASGNCPLCHASLASRDDSRLTNVDIRLPDGGNPIAPPGQDTPREKIATTLGGIAVVIPALIASNFMPLWNVFPFGIWFIIAVVGAGVAGAIATPRTLPGIISGAVAGVGVFSGIWLYVGFRAAATQNHTFLQLEFLIPIVLGSAPGLLLYGLWARELRR